MENMNEVLSDSQLYETNFTTLDCSCYTVLNMIDYGSFGDIFKVVSDKGNKIYALKQILYKGDIRRDPYILSELLCLSRLDHRNIIKMHELLVGEGEINIIMDYAENENIARYLEVSGPIPYPDMHSIYSQITEAVSYCHSSDIAHRDLTPANVLLTRHMVVKLADFGLAVRCSDQTGRPLLCSDYLGHVAYLSPEVLSQKPFLPKPADIWSLGIVLCYLLFNAIPYKGLECHVTAAQAAETWREFAFTEPMSYVEISRSDIAAILDGMLHLTPTSRTDIDAVSSVWDSMATDNKDDRLETRQS